MASYRGPKAPYIKSLFRDIANHYDGINTILSWGQMDSWRKKLVALADPPPRGLVLDLGAGTGEVTYHLLQAMEGGEVVALDFSSEMLEKARGKLLSDQERVSFCLGDAMDLHFPDNTFDCTLTAFVLRNVEDIHQVLQEMRRVTKKGGRILSLDLGRPQQFFFRHLYFLYFNHVLPFLGNLIMGQGKPYTYLRDSLQDFPHQEGLAQLFRLVGLREVEYFNLLGGVVMVHRGEK